MAEIIKMSLKEWIEKFKPSVGTCGWDDIIEATDEQLESIDGKHVWTSIYDGEGYGSEYIYNGAHFVNRNAYFITEIPFENYSDTFIITICEPDEYDLMDFLIRTRSKAQRQVIVADFEFYFNITLNKDNLMDMLKRLRSEARKQEFIEEFKRYFNVTLDI